jgi:hypothetical protein
MSQVGALNSYRFTGGNGKTVGDLRPEKTRRRMAIVLARRVFYHLTTETHGYCIHDAGYAGRIVDGEKIRDKLFNKKKTRRKAKDGRLIYYKQVRFGRSTEKHH